MPPERHKGKQINASLIFYCTFIGKKNCHKDPEAKGRKHARPFVIEKRKTDNQ
jgi:hypothetical protein